jgi:hypothetical protein
MKMYPDEEVESGNHALFVAQEKFNISSSIKIVLESDGTLVDEEYFGSVEKNTALMVLKEEEEWSSGEQYVSVSVYLLYTFLS